MLGRGDAFQLVVVLFPGIGFWRHVADGLDHAGGTVDGFPAPLPAGRNPSRGRVTRPQLHRGDRSAQRRRPRASPGSVGRERPIREFAEVLRSKPAQGLTSASRLMPVGVIGRRMSKSDSPLSFHGKTCWYRRNVCFSSAPVMAASLAQAQLEHRICAGIVLICKAVRTH